MTVISFVLPVYNESGNIELFFSTLSAAFADERPDLDLEFVFVNDGSKDDSFTKLAAIADRDPRARVLDFSRNFGHQMAVTAGLDAVTGDAVIIMDTDMQDPPGVAVELIDDWERGFDVVYAERRSRKDSIFKKVSASMFYRLLSWAAEINIPRNTGDFRLLDREVVEALKRFPERGRFIRGMVSYVGFKQVSHPFDRDERHSGVTGYPLSKMIRFASDGIIGFSTVPLKIIRAVGWLVTAASALGIIYVLIGRIFAPQTLVPGWALTVIAILLVGGVQIVMLSVLGSYIGRIYSEVQGRPLYVIGAVYPDPERHNRGGRRPGPDSQPST